MQLLYQSPEYPARSPLFTATILLEAEINRLLEKERDIMTQKIFGSTIRIIQAGMGVNISSWFLARIASMLGCLGTISGVAPERIVAEILGRGDQGGHIRRALSHFPFPSISEKVIADYYIEEGNPQNKKRKNVPPYTVFPPRSLIELIVCSNFAIVWLAKEGHDGPISINYLEKISMPHIYAILGAMLAGVDVITMGAGIPLHIPEVIDAIAEGRMVRYPIMIVGDTEMTWMSFNPEEFFGSKLPSLEKPRFLPIISSNTLAKKLARELGDRIFGFVVETPTAGGHNAPPRGKSFDDEGEPIYGDKDKVDYAELTSLGYPFWIGGSYASPEGLKLALEQGATGIQVGTAFALSEDSGMEPSLRNEVRRLGYEGQLKVKTSMYSPTGFPFKVAMITGTLSDPTVYNSRTRVCDQCALRTPYRRPDRMIGYRCSAEPIEHYVKKGGKLEDTTGVRCICNGLIATAGLGDLGEAPIVTVGDDVSFLQHLMTDEHSAYHAKDVIGYILGRSSSNDRS